MTAKMFYRSFLVSKDCEFRFYATLLSVPKYQRNGHCPALHQQKYWPQIRAWPGGIQYLRDINNYAKPHRRQQPLCLIVYIKFMAKNVIKTWYPSIQSWIYHHIPSMNSSFRDTSIIFAPKLATQSPVAPSKILVISPVIDVKKRKCVGRS